MSYESLRYRKVSVGGCVEMDISGLTDLFDRIFLRWLFVDIERLKDKLTESRNIANLNVHKNKYDNIFI